MTLGLIVRKASRMLGTLDHHVGGARLQICFLCGDKENDLNGYGL